MTSIHTVLLAVLTGAVLYIAAVQSGWHYQSPSDRALAEHDRIMQSLGLN
jgi:hypothetical protein